jgi:hypothetical protein
MSNISHSAIPVNAIFWNAEHNGPRECLAGPMIQIQVSDQKLEYFKQVAGIDDRAYAAISQDFRERSGRLPTIGEFTAELRPFVSSEQALALSSTLITVRRLKERYECSVPEILDGIANALKDKGASPDEIDRWRSKKDNLTELVEAELTGTTENASDLYYRHINYCHDFKVITESRPIFSNNNESVLGYVTINNLYLVFSRGNRREATLSIALGLEQLKGMQREISKAIDQTLKYRDICEKENKFNRIFDSKR